MLIASLAIQDIADRGYFGKIRIGKKRGTSNVGVVQGGEATNQVTDLVYVRGESRSHDPKFVVEITKAYKSAFERAARKVKSRTGGCGKIKFRSKLDYGPFRLDRSEPVVRESVAAAKALGHRLKLVSVDGGLDANHMNARGLPTVTLGAGQHSPHTVDEYIVVREYLDGCRLALKLATGG